MNLVFETTFTVFPQHTNYNPPMLFGGELLSQMDIAAAMAARRFLYDSPTCKDALTVAVSDVTFHVGAAVKDLIFLRATIIRAGIKSIGVLVEGWREKGGASHEKICDGVFTFCAISDDGKPAAHELKISGREQDGK